MDLNNVPATEKVADKQSDSEKQEIDLTAYVEKTPEHEVETTLSPPKSFWEELKPWSYTSKQSFFKSLARPLVFALSPAVWFAFFACKFITSMFGLRFTFHPFVKMVWPPCEFRKFSHCIVAHNFLAVG